MVIFLPIFATPCRYRPAEGYKTEKKSKYFGNGFWPPWFSLGASKRVALLIFLSACLLPLGASPSWGAIYKYEDENGVVHFTNCPREPKFKLYIREPEDYASKGANYVSYSHIRDTTRYDRLIREYSKKYQVDFALVKAVIRAESGFNPYAVSRKGARGLMQLMPETAQRMNVSNIHSPRDNIEGGVRYLKYLLYLFNNDLHLSLAAYNAGENLVSQLGSIPPYRETVDYVQRVMNYYQYYRQ